MNKKKTFLVSTAAAVFFLVLAGSFTLALSGSSTNYVLSPAIQAAAGAEGSGTNFGLGSTLDSSPSGFGASTNYDVCLGYWCELGVVPNSPCTPPASGNWVISSSETVLCKNVTINMPLDGNLTIFGTLVFNNVTFNMNANNNGTANITIESSGFFSTVDSSATQPNPGSTIQSGNGKQYLFQVLGGGVDIENSEIKSVGFRSQAPVPPELGVYVKGTYNVIFRNNVISNTIYGLVLEEVNSAVIEKNIVTTSKTAGITNVIALHLTKSTNNDVKENELVNSDIGVFVFSQSNENKFTSNVFTNAAVKTLSVSSTSLNNIVLDSVFSKDTLTTIDTSNVTRKWFHNVHVKNGDGEDIGGAEVKIIPKALQGGPTPTPGPLTFLGQIVTHDTTPDGLTPLDEAIQYSQNLQGDNNPYYDSYNMTACVQRDQIYCGYTEENIDASGTTEVTIAGVDREYGCTLTVNPQTVNYPPARTNVMTITFDSYYAERSGVYGCGVTGQKTPFQVPATAPFVVTAVCPETGAYPEVDADYGAYASIPLEGGQNAAYCDDTTYVRSAFGPTPTPTPNPSVGPTSYPSEVSFLSASCPVGLVFSDSAEVTGYAVVKGVETCDFALPNPWNVVLKDPQGGAMIKTNADYCDLGKSIFAFDTPVEGAYSVAMSVDTDAGRLSSSCNFRVLKQAPSKFPELPLALVVIAAIGVFVYLSRYSNKGSKKTR